MPYRAMREGVGITIRGLEAATGINRGRLSVIERGVQATPAEHDKIVRFLVAAMAAKPAPQGDQS